MVGVGLGASGGLGTCGGLAPPIFVLAAERTLEGGPNEGPMWIIEAEFGL